MDSYKLPFFHELFHVPLGRWLELLISKLDQKIEDNFKSESVMLVLILNLFFLRNI
jgi:hypothetical protein